MHWAHIDLDTSIRYSYYENLLDGEESHLITYNSKIINKSKCKIACLFEKSIIIASNTSMNQYD